MRPLKLTITGEYWDSFLYKGRLHLFTRNGSIETIRWDTLISDFRLNDSLLKLPFICAFLRSDYLYGAELTPLTSDAEIREIISNRFDLLAQSTFELSKDAIKNHLIKEMDNKFYFPHSDIDIYTDNIYVGSSSGLMAAPCNKHNSNPIGRRPDRMWDGPVLGLSASYGSLAMASGSEGLYEYALRSENVIDGNDVAPRRLSKLVCNECNWNYFSIFGSSDVGGFLADFSDGYIDESTGYDYQQYSSATPVTDQRRKKKVVNSDRIFGSSGYAWGVKDKICQASDGGISVARYNPWAKASRNEEKIASLGTIDFAHWKGDLISASSALFGIVAELEHAIIVITSAGQSITLAGEPINWRFFVRSKHYENQLHIVYDDRIEILSFNHDYVIDQNTKLAGIRFSDRARRAPGRGLGPLEM
ncbi:MAG TPA: hypothetical protein VJR90_00890 [Gammaproteobacteria bacterium]|nr:hypothetical protein [Gammaproteobacteria bacterium]